MPFEQGVFPFCLNAYVFKLCLVFFNTTGVKPDTSSLKDMENTGISALKMLSDEHQCVGFMNKWASPQLGQNGTAPVPIHWEPRILQAYGVVPSGNHARGLSWLPCHLDCLIFYSGHSACWYLVYSVVFLLFSYFWSCPFTLIILPEQHSSFFDLAFVSTSFSREVRVAAAPGWQVDPAWGCCPTHHLPLTGQKSGKPQKRQNGGSLCPKHGSFGKLKEGAWVCFRTRCVSSMKRGCTAPVKHQDSTGLPWEGSVLPSLSLPLLQ